MLYTQNVKHRNQSASWASSLKFRPGPSCRTIFDVLFHFYAFNPFAIHDSRRQGNKQKCTGKIHRSAQQN